MSINKLKLNILTTLWHDARLLHVLCFGIISGMPFAILASLMPLWLQDAGLALSTITTFAIARTPYAFKFLWSPLVDGVKLPILYNIFGKRLSWMALTSIINCVSLLILTTCNPLEHSALIMVIVCIIGACGATYDISYDAMRIDMLDDQQQSMGVAVTSLGFRLGALLAYSGGLIIADLENWETTFVLMASIFAMGLIMMSIYRKRYFFTVVTTNSIKERFKVFCVEPFLDFFNKKNALMILCAIIIYKLGEAMLAQILSLFYREIGFSKTTIGTIGKFTSFIASVLGSFIAVYVISRMKLFKGMIVCDFFQAVTNCLYIWLHHVPTTSVLVVTIFTDNLTGALGSVALTTFLTSLCNKKYSATHFAMLTSLTAFANSTLTTTAGSLVEYMGWDMFFVMTFLLAFPGMLAIAYLNKQNQQTE